MSTGREPSAEEIRADIERTRERLGHTVEALGAHLNPSLLKQRVRASVREATVGRVKTMASNARDKAEETGRGLIATLRDNPIPAAMIAGGIGWLLFSSRRGSQEHAQEEGDYRAQAGTGIEGSASMDLEGDVDYSRQLPDVGASPHGAVSQAAATARSAAGRVASGARSVGEQVASGARTAGERVASTTSQVAHGVAERARAGGQQIEETYRENPLVLGAVAAAVGLAVGMTLPVTEREAHLLGSKRDELVDKARAALTETKEKVRHAAERAVPEVGATLKEVAREEGLAGS